MEIKYLFCPIVIHIHSPAVMMGYLMREHDMILDEAEKLVQTKWSKTKPNKGFVEQLEDFDLDMEDEKAAR